MLTKLETGSVFSKKVLNDIKDPFAKELLDLWNQRCMKGYCVLYQDYILLPGDRFKCKVSPVLGFILVEKSPSKPRDEATIRGLYVSPEVRGRRLATRLIQYVQNLSVQDKEGHVFGEKKIWVNITKGAENIYTRQGFKILGTRKDFPDQVVAYYGPVPQEDIQARLKTLKTDD